MTITFGSVLMSCKVMCGCGGNDVCGCVWMCVDVGESLFVNVDDKVMRRCVA